MLLVELVALLKQEDELSLLELLNITSEQICDRFEDIIEEHADRIEEYFGGDTSVED